MVVDCGGGGFWSLYVISIRVELVEERRCGSEVEENSVKQSKGLGQQEMGHLKRGSPLDM